MVPAHLIAFGFFLRSLFGQFLRQAKPVITTAAPAIPVQSLKALVHPTANRSEGNSDVENSMDRFQPAFLEHRKNKGVRALPS